MPDSFYQYLEKRMSNSNKDLRSLIIDAIDKWKSMTSGFQDFGARTRNRFVNTDYRSLSDADLLQFYTDLITNGSAPH